MMNKKKLVVALTAGLAVGVSSAVSANPFKTSSMESSYNAKSAQIKLAEGSCGGKKGGGSCGGDKKDSGKCGHDKKGSGKCGHDKKADGNCGAKKSDGKCGSTDDSKKKSGKCGSGKCGS